MAMKVDAPHEARTPPACLTAAVELPPDLRKSLLTEAESSRYLLLAHNIKRAPATMRKDRIAGTGPAFRRRNRSIFYERTELDRWADATLSPPLRSTSAGG